MTDVAPCGLAGQRSAATAKAVARRATAARTEPRWWCGVVIVPILLAALSIARMTFLTTLVISKENAK